MPRHCDKPVTVAEKILKKTFEPSPVEVDQSTMRLFERGSIAPASSPVQLVTCATRRLCPSASAHNAEDAAASRRVRLLLGVIAGRSRNSCGR
jgi:hypothetical protein